MAAKTEINAHVISKLLDRINNNLGHNNDNVVISCYECNIKRGTMDYERFKKGKEIKIVRKSF